MSAHANRSRAGEAPMLTKRQRAEATIRYHFGTDTRLGRKLLNEIIVRYNAAIAERILEILPDDALDDLARAHRAAADERAMRFSLGPGANEESEP